MNDESISDIAKRLEKVEAELARQRAANDELFLIKQKVVIVNRELRFKNDQLEIRIKELEAANMKLTDRLALRVEQ